VIKEKLNMLSSGDILKDHYSILKLVEKGDYGDVYQAYDTITKSHVAIKMITPNLKTGEDLDILAKTFFEEFEFLKNNPHENLVKYLDAFQLKESFYYVTEWIDGETPDQLVKTKNETQKKKVILNLYHSLAVISFYLHSRPPGFSFYLLRPKDIVIDKEGVAKVVDVGLATKLHSFRVPEGYVIPDEDKDEKRDVFFIGAVIYELITNIKPDTDFVGSLPQIDKKVKNIPKTLTRIITLSVAPRRERYGLVRDLKKDLITYFPEYTDEAIKSGEKPLDEQLRSKEKGMMVSKISCITAIVIITTIIIAISYFSVEIEKRYEMYLLNSCEKNMTVIGDALERYKKDNNYYPDKMEKLVPKYLSEIPKCPSALLANSGYEGTYEVLSYGKGYRFCCKGSNHFRTGITGDYPVYNSTEGLIRSPQK
jgi:serine/threonine protein kinase